MVLFTWCTLIVVLFAVRLGMAVRLNARRLRAYASPRADRKPFTHGTLKAKIEAVCGLEAHRAA